MLKSNIVIDVQMTMSQGTSSPSRLLRFLCVLKKDFGADEIFHQHRLNDQRGHILACASQPCWTEA